MKTISNHRTACGGRITLMLMAAIAAWCQPAYGQAEQLQIHAFESATLTDQEFLSGAGGAPVTLAGVLRIPVTGDDTPRPAVLLLHGSGGVSSHAEDWAEEFSRMGMATFLIDSFTGRGITDALSDMSRLGRLTMVIDAYRGLHVLANHPMIDRERIAVFGLSRGGQAALYASLRRFADMHGPEAGIDFAAYVALYPLCNTRFLADTELVDRPVRIFHGGADDYNPVSYCRDFVARLKAGGNDVELQEYPGAHHVFDWPAIPRAVRFADIQTVRSCALEERTTGVIVHRETGMPFSYADPCVERGVTAGFNEPAYHAALGAVRSFLWNVLLTHPLGSR